MMQVNIFYHDRENIKHLLSKQTAKKPNLSNSYTTFIEDESCVITERTMIEHFSLLLTVLKKYTIYRSGTV
jgi:hypothetical protein